MSFEQKLRNFVDEKIRLGRNGIDMNCDKKGQPESLLFRNYEMSDATFNLGRDIQKSMPELDHKSWAHWMINTEIYHYGDHVTIYHRTPFFAENADKYLGNAIRKHYNIPVTFKADYSLNRRVEV
jgi:hypothetical protein